MSNVTDTFTTKTVEVLASDMWPAFDALPLAIRRALNDAPYDIDPLDIAAHWEAARFWGGQTAYEFAQEMKWNFRGMVQQNSYTKLEKDGHYEFQKPAARKVRRVLPYGRSRRRAIALFGPGT